MLRDRSNEKNDRGANDTGIGNATVPLWLATVRRHIDGEKRCGELRWFWRRLAWLRLECQVPPRGHMTAGGAIPSGGKTVGANTSGASANGDVTGGASITGTGTPAITATAPMPRRRILSRGLRLDLTTDS